MTMKIKALEKTLSLETLRSFKTAKDFLTSPTEIKDRGFLITSKCLRTKNMLHSQRLSIHERLTSSCRSAQIFPQILLPAGRCSDFPKIMLPVPLRFSKDNSASWSVGIFQRRLCFLVAQIFQRRLCFLRLH
jgi:hypothetical protein